MESEELKNLDNFDNILDFIALRFKIGMNPKCCKKPWKLTTFEHSFDKFDYNTSITFWNDCKKLTKFWRELQIENNSGKNFFVDFDTIE